MTADPQSRVKSFQKRRENKSGDAKGAGLRGQIACTTLSYDDRGGECDHGWIIAVKGAVSRCAARRAGGEFYARGPGRAARNGRALEPRDLLPIRNERLAAGAFEMQRAQIAPTQRRS